jgi:two-component system cell cycle response regulator DivK
MTEPKKILYVEDTFENRMLIRRILQADGFTVLEAENARHAMQVLDTETPDLILMDINMPDMDGYTLTQHLREIPHLTRIPIVALTANVMRGDRERTLAAGCDGYIQKPIDVDTFSNQLNHYLER